MNNIPNFTQRLEQLIAAASVSSALPELDMSNKLVINLLAGWLEDLGFTIQIQDITGSPGKQNMIARLGEGSGGLVLSGHTDTVPYDANGWQSDPFKVRDADNQFFGLGTTDMKGFFAIVIDAIQALGNIDSGKLRAPIIIVATADEECSMSGARALSQAGIDSAEYAIIGEPTDLRPIRMHKGMMMETIRITGQSGHSSNPELGNNALEAMQDVLFALRRFRSEMQSEFQHSGFDINVPTLNLGCIHGGDNPNRICGRCDLQFDIRPLPGMSINNLRTDIGQILAPVASEYGIDIEHEHLFEGVEAFEQEPESPLVRDAEAACGTTAASVAYATEAPFFKSLGMQTIVLGPGSIDQAHQPNEYLPQNQIKPAAKLYQQFIERYCLKG